jgi:hypothetical protein
MHCFFDFEKRRDKGFDRERLEDFGMQLTLSMHDYLKLICGKDVPIPPIPEQSTKKKPSKTD